MVLVGGHGANGYGESQHGLFWIRVKVDGCFFNDPAQHSVGLCTDADREFLKGKEQSIKARTAQTVIENGRDLLEAKARVGHGNFLNWIKGTLPWSEATVRNMMYVAENFKSLTVNDLNSFQTRALYALAAPSVPESARQEAIDLAESGEKVTHADAQELIRAHKIIAEHEKRWKSLGASTITAPL